MDINVPENTVELSNGTVYRRKPWRRGTNALVAIGRMEDERKSETDGSGNTTSKLTGNRVFVAQSAGIINPLKASKKSVGK